MGLHKRKLNRKTEPPASSSSLKKLGAKKITAANKTTPEIIIDLKQTSRNYSSIIDLALRSFINSVKEPMPRDLKPMLATLTEESFNDTNWQFELKLDGYRTLAYLRSGKVDLRSRNNNSFNKKFNAIHSALENWKINAVVDGEVVVLNEEGRPDFNSIQLWEKKKHGQIVYYVFDLLWIEGYNIMNEPLHKRRSLLAQLIPDNGIVRFSDHIDEIGKDFFEIAKSNSLEGIIAKKKDSVYIPDSRAKTWLKIKAEQRHEAIICGYTKKRDTDREFSSLILGLQKNDQVEFIGQAGTGYSSSLQNELMKKMKPLTTKKCPFKTEPPISDPIVWLKAFLVCEVKYTELTSEGVMRHASFQGLREDKSAFELNTDEEIVPVNEIPVNEESHLLVKPGKTEAIVKIDDHDLKLTNLSKIYWPKEKIRKGDMLNYYYGVAEFMMPYMKDRPQSLNRFPNGINGESFYHKNMGGKVEKWLNTFKRISESAGGEPKDFLICSNTASLIYMANLGCIEMNPWHSRIQSPNYPDWCVVDLDPGKISFEKVIETALMVKKILDSLDIPSYPKTSGSEGIHIYIPLGAKYNYEQSKQLAELIANMVHEELPSFTSIIRNPEKRKDKIYIDFLQNRPIQTICAPYSIRPKPGATVSMPLHWDEVKKGLKISNFTIKNSIDRVKAEGDLFKGVLGKGIDLNKILKGLSNLI